MKKIAICNTSFEPGDAVSNDMMGMNKILVKMGYAVQVFAEAASLSTLTVLPIEALPEFVEDPEDICIYHYATGWDKGLNILSNIRCYKVVRYHNVTPPEFFCGICNDYFQVCEYGHRALQELPKLGVNVYLACSEYSKRELVLAGAEESDCGVVPPFHQVDRLKGIESDLLELDRFNDEFVNLLMVGRLAPNKGYDRLIEAFSYYSHEYNPTSRLLIVGGLDQKLQSYKVHLKNQIARSGLEKKVFFLGKVSDAALKAYYLVADVFAIMSQHEGFCVPIVEAMSMKIPIVAVAGTAITGTVGDSGILWEEFDPEWIAASVNAIACDEHLHFSLGEMGWKRYEEYFSNEKIEHGFLRVLGPFL